MTNNPIHDIECPECGKSLEIDESCIGQKLKCPFCLTYLKVKKSSQGHFIVSSMTKPQPAGNNPVNAAQSQLHSHQPQQESPQIQQSQQSFSNSPLPNDVAARVKTEAFPLILLLIGLCGSFLPITDNLFFKEMYPNLTVAHAFLFPILFTAASAILCLMRLSQKRTLILGGLLFALTLISLKSFFSIHNFNAEIEKMEEMGHKTNSAIRGLGSSSFSSRDQSEFNSFLNSSDELISAGKELIDTSPGLGLYLVTFSAILTLLHIFGVFNLLIAKLNESNAAQPQQGNPNNYT